MLNIAFLPNDPARTCLDIPSLTSSLSSISSPFTIHSELTSQVQALIWLPNITQGNTSSELSSLFSSPSASRVCFVQLPMTGVDDFIPLIRATSEKITWCCAKGCYSNPVAEHSISLALALLRRLTITPPGAAGEIDTLFHKKVLIVGSGSIAQAIRQLLVPFTCTVNLLDSSTTRSTLLTLLPEAQIVFIACPLTPTTTNPFNSQVLKAMRRDAILINIARGEIVDTTALIDFLKLGKIKAAGLDVIAFGQGEEGEKQKEELEELKKEGKLVVTDHSAIPHHLIADSLGERIKYNLEVMARGGGREELLGLVDAKKGY